MGGVSLVKRIAGAWRAMRGDVGFQDKWYEVYPGAKTLSGTRINQSSSLTISALFAGLNFLAGTMAMLPKIVFRRLPGGGTEHAVDHPLYDRLHNKPNDLGLSSWQWIYSSIMHKYLWGNWYDFIDAKSYQDQQLIPLLPERMVEYDEEKKTYLYRLKNGMPIYFRKDQILHIPHISMDGIQGKGIIHYARESLGLAKAQDEFAATFFGQGLHAGGFVEVDHDLKEPIRAGLQKDFNQKYGGLGRNWKAIFLTGGAKFQPADIDASKAQALESREFAVVEVARWVNLPPHILRDLARATYSNIEEQALELVIYSLLPVVTQIEQIMNITLFDDEQRRTHFIKFELKGLLRGDLKTRTEFYVRMLDRGVFNADQVLALEDMNPQPDGLGQLFAMPLNMVNKKDIVSPPPLTIEENSNPILQLTAKRAVQTRSAAVRRRLTIAYRPKFEKFAGQLVRKEVGAVRAALKEMMSEKGLADLMLWLDDFYRDFPETIEKVAAPTLSSYATAILPVAQEEAGSEADISLEYTDFQRQYRETFAERHVISSHAQLKDVIRKAQDEDEDVLAAVELRLDEWEERRPGKIVMRETVQTESAFAKSVFVLCGILKIRSIAYGKNCPFCNALNGKVIGVDQYFLPKGDFQPEGADHPLKVSRSRGHPPYHGACDCGIGVST